jgi:hypothetical protein
VLEVELADHLKVATWNNGLSDVGDHTLIGTDSKVYDALADLEKATP